MKTYELFDTDLGQGLKALNPDGTISFIPMAESNSDYAEYLRLQAWLAEGKKEADFWKQDN